MEVKKLVQNIFQKLDEMSEAIDQLNQKVDHLIGRQELTTQASMGKIPKADYLQNIPLDVVTLLSLPDNLRKSAIALSKLKEATAEDVAKETERARAVESSYLNQLVTMGHIQKKRKGRTVYFYIGE
jgi:outer membrane murein-binding lipoprotein Lpp